MTIRVFTLSERSSNQVSTTDLSWYTGIRMLKVNSKYWNLSTVIQVEAATFIHYLANHHALMTVGQLRQQMPLPVTSEDFLLGVADLTGEVMRYSLHLCTVGK